MKRLNFKPLSGLTSCHLQTIFAAYKSPGHEPPSKSWLVELDADNTLSCEVTTPLQWQNHQATIVLLHGLGGSHRSSYMIRLSRKLSNQGHRVVRVNLRGCGTGKGLCKLPYNAGNSHDLLKVLQKLKRENPYSEVTVMGFSLGGNIVLKLAGELRQQAQHLVQRFIAVCAPFDLGETVRLIEKKQNWLYHYYYLKEICRQARPWVDHKIRTLYEFDQKVTAQLWGFKSADEYYQHSSSKAYLSHIAHETHIIYAEDDPFISPKALQELKLSDQVHLWASKHGGHLGFIGRTPKEHQSFWLDHLLVNWANGNWDVS